MNYYQQQLEWLKSFVSETYDNGIAGKASSQRIIELAIIAGFLAVFLKVTLALVITATAGATLTILDIPWGWATVIMGILGLKVYQKKKQDELESNNGDPKPEAKP